MATQERKSRVFTMSLPPEMARKVEAIAKLEGKTVSELFRAAFNTYNEARLDRLFEATAAYAATRNPHGYTEEDIPRLVKEVRAEMRAEKEAAEVLTHS